MRQYLLVSMLFLLHALGSSTPASAQTQSYTKVAPAAPTVHLLNGQGTEIIYLSKSQASPLPSRITSTDAVGKVNTLPAKDITIGAIFPLGANTFSVSVNVVTSQYIDPGTAYQASLLLFDSANMSTPTAVNFTIEDDNSISFDVIPKTISGAVGGLLSPQQRIHVRNTGKVVIASFQITSTLLSDTVNHYNVKMTPVLRTVNLSPNQAGDLDFDLPEPEYAGNYVGTIIVSANNISEQSLALTVQSRGPYSKYKLPFALFVLVIVLGFYISTTLDNWFGMGGGLTQAQAYISLNDSEKVFVDQIDHLKAWKATLPITTPPIDVPQAEVWIPQQLNAVRALLSRYSDLAITDLSTQAQTFATQASAASLLWLSIETANSHWTNQPQILHQACQGLDGVALPQSQGDITRYSNDLTAVLAATAKAQTQAQAQPMNLQLAITTESVINLNEKSRSEDGEKERTRDINKIRKMKFFYKLIVWTVVFVTAYLSFYATHWSFGTLADYLAVFLWALGLTSTGTQIVSRMHKP